MYKKFGSDFLFIPACLFFKRRALNGIEWNEKLRYSEDWDYYLTILKNNFLFRHIDSPLVIYRNTSDSLSKNLSGTFKANYKILSKWAENFNLVYIAKRCALLYKKNILFYLTKKMNVIIKPRIQLRHSSLQLLPFLFFPYSYTLFLLVLEAFRITFKASKKKLN